VGDECGIDPDSWSEANVMPPRRGQPQVVKDETIHFVLGVLDQVRGPEPSTCVSKPESIGSDSAITHLCVVTTFTKTLLVWTYSDKAGRTLEIIVTSALLRRAKYCPDVDNAACKPGIEAGTPAFWQIYILPPTLRPPHRIAWLLLTPIRLATSWYDRHLINSLAS